MKCAHCENDLATDELTCGSCGKTVIRNKEDLNRVDHRSTAMIGWAVFAVGALAFIFVIVNMNVLGLSGLDFVVPTALLAIGTGTVLYARSQKSSSRN